MKEYDDNTLEGCEIKPVKPNHLLSFNNKEGENVGGFDFNGAEMVFTGQADESAKIFVDWVATVFAGRLSEEYLRGRTDALKDHGILGA